LLLHRWIFSMRQMDAIIIGLQPNKNNPAAKINRKKIK